jgi:hypothetical protein
VCVCVCACMCVCVCVCVYSGVRQTNPSGRAFAEQNPLLLVPGFFFNKKYTWNSRVECAVCGRMRTYADVCGRMLQVLSMVPGATSPTSPAVAKTMLVLFFLLFLSAASVFVLL